MLTPDQIEQIARRDLDWRRNPGGRGHNNGYPVGRATNAAQAANDRCRLLEHVRGTIWRPHERYAARRQLRAARVALCWAQLQWWVSYLSLVAK